MMQLEFPESYPDHIQQTNLEYCKDISFPNPLLAPSIKTGFNFDSGILSGGLHSFSEFRNCFINRKILLKNAGIAAN